MAAGDFLLHATASTVWGGFASFGFAISCADTVLPCGKTADGRFVRMRSGSFGCSKWHVSGLPPQGCCCFTGARCHRARCAETAPLLDFRQVRCGGCLAFGLRFKRRYSFPARQQSGLCASGGQMVGTGKMGRQPRFRPRQFHAR